MPRFLEILLPILGIVIIADVVEPAEPPYKVYPLILFHTSGDKLQHPNGFKVTNAILFTYKKYEFIARDTKRQLLFCPATDDDKIKSNIKAHQKSGQGGVVTVTEDDYYNVEIEVFFMLNFIKFMKLRDDLPRCEKEPEPFISKIFPDSDEIQEDGHRNQEMIPCGPEGNGKLYRYGYEILLNKELMNKVKKNLDHGLTISTLHPKEDMIDYEIYRFCYDDKTKTVIYTQHKLISPQLLSNRHLWKERRHHYDMSSNNYGFEEFDFEEREKKYQRYLLKKFREKTSSEETDEPSEPSHSELPFEMEQLVPVNDFALALWMKPTNHYLNVDLMNRKLSKLWNEVLKSIQHHAHANELEFDVYTKTFNLIQKNSDDDERNSEIVLEENAETLKSPQIWIKIVVNRPNEKVSQGVAIMVNNHMNTELNPHIYEYCEIDYCKTFEIEKFPDEYQHEYVRCCSISEKIEKLFNLNPKLNTEDSEVTGLILIEGLINPSNTTNDLKLMNTKTESEITTDDSEIKSEI